MYGLKLRIHFLLTSKKKDIVWCSVAFKSLIFWFKENLYNSKAKIMLGPIFPLTSMIFFVS